MLFEMVGMVELTVVMYFNWKSLETIPETSNARSKSKSKPSNHSPDVVDVMNKVEKLNLSSKPSADTTNVDQLETQLSGMTIRSPREQGAGMPKSNSKRTKILSPSDNTPTLDGRPNRLYISSPKCETPKN